MNAIEQQISKISAPVKPLLPGIARFLLVVTFFEDSLRIVSQWDDQVYYLSQHQGFIWGLAPVFLALNVIFMLVCSTLAIAKKKSEFAIAGLTAVVVSQWIGYGMMFDLSFSIRNLSIFGGLLMLLADSYSSSRKNLFAGLPTLNQRDKSTYLQLAGRILLVLLFLSFVFSGEYSILRTVVSVIGLIACVMIVIGLKAKYTAWFLIAILSISNVVLNNWWTLHHEHPNRDFKKYDFFQTLSICGGFLLLANMGAGGISIDENKKEF